MGVLQKAHGMCSTKMGQEKQGLMIRLGLPPCSTLISRWYNSGIPREMRLPSKLSIAIMQMVQVS